MPINVGAGLCGEGACPRWTAQQSQNLNTRFVKYNQNPDIGVASRPNGGKPPRHKSPLVTETRSHSDLYQAPKPPSMVRLAPVM
jgi:hypothetical protein